MRNTDKKLYITYGRPMHSVPVDYEITLKSQDEFKSHLFSSPIIHSSEAYVNGLQVVKNGLLIQDVLNNTQSVWDNIDKT